MTITSQTTTQTTHRATLAGGITISLDSACFGATLTLSAPGRALTLALTPEQVVEMAQWDIPSDAWPLPLTMTAFESSWFFVSTARRDALCATYDLTDDDIATLRALARAAQCPACDGTGTIETYPAHGVEAYTGAGDPRVDYLPCDQCGGTGLARADQETQP